MLQIGKEFNPKFCSFKVFYQLICLKYYNPTHVVLTESPLALLEFIIMFVNFFFDDEFKKFIQINMILFMSTLVNLLKICIFLLSALSSN